MEKRSFARAAWILLAVSAAALTLALAEATPGIAGFSKGRYVGTSSQTDQGDQKLNVGVKVSGNKKRVNITYFEFLNIGCASVTQIAGEWAKIKRKGKFRYEPADPVFSSGYVAGKFKRHKVSGTAKFPDRCGGLIRWRAKLSN